VVLCVLDGWGHRVEREHNAIAQARTPTYDRLLATAPHGLLNTSADAVGLPPGQMGNSEVGHTCIGAGRVVLQDLPRIDAAIADSSLAANPTLAELADKLRAAGGTCHLMGLLSPGGVHAHQGHMAVLARHLAAAGIPVAVHAFLDGRDTPPKSARVYVDAFLTEIADLKGVAIATVSGRYYAMDRDKRWERVALAYQAVAEGTGEPAADPRTAIDAAYEAGESDEFVRPRVIGDYAGMVDRDGLLMANFRADRVRQILAALLDPGFDGFARPRPVSFAAACGMTSYSAALDRRLATLFPPQALANTLGEIVAAAGLRQLRIAETEKYAHVTFFLNGGAETVCPGEDRILVPTPKVASYDLKPEMSAPEVTDRLVEAVASGTYDLIVANYANADMVGHTGDLDAAVAAIEAVDTCLGRLVAAVEDAGGVLLVTADHGNAENMRDSANDAPHTAHTTNLVPAVLVGATARVAGLRDGTLVDVAPTLLAFLDLPQPAEMTGRSLLILEAETASAGMPREQRVPG
jgi:2,3-bisphosphoglycerate-independent phosphoglycerate mutase